MRSAPDWQNVWDSHFYDDSVLDLMIDELDEKMPGNRWQRCTFYQAEPCDQIYRRSQ